MWLRDDDDDDDDTTKKGRATTGQGRKPSRRRKATQGDLQVRMCLGEPLSFHMAKLVADGLIAKVSALPADLVNKPDLHQPLIAMCKAIYDTMKQKFMSHPLADDPKYMADFAELVFSVMTVFMCLHPVECERPRPNIVREASRCIRESPKLTGPTSELAKAMLSFKGAERTLDAASRHAASGMADDASSASFVAGVDSFEAAFGQAFDDLEVWLVPSDGPPQTMKRLTVAFQGIGSMQVQLMSSLERWSATALAEQIETVRTILANMTELLECGILVTIAEVQSKVFSAFHALAPVVEAPGLGHELPARDLDGATCGVQPAPVERPPSQAPPDAMTTLHLLAGKKSVEGDRPHAAAVRAVRAEVNTFIDYMSKLAETTCKLTESTDKRAGETTFDTGCSPEDCENDLKITGVFMLKLLDFMQATLDVTAIASFEPLQSIVNIERVQVDRILTFIQASAALDLCLLPDGEWPLACRCSVDPGPTIDLMSQSIRIFKEDIAKPITTTHVTPFLNIALADIGNAIMTVKLLDETVMRDQPATDLLGMVIREPPWETLLTDEEIVLHEDADGFALQGALYNRAYSEFAELVMATGMIEVNMQMLLPKGSKKVMMQAPLAGMYLRTICVVRDASVVAAYLQRNILDRDAKDAPLSDDSINHNFASALGCFNKLIADMDSLLQGSEAFSLESEGWDLALSMPMARAWCKSMFVFGDRSLSALISLWMRGLTSVAEACASACPNWQAAFNNKVLNLPLLQRICSGRLSAIAASHNKLHDYMSKLNTMANHLQISPRLKEHELCAEPIAVALNIMAKASDAVTICTGAAILADGTHDLQASAKAKNFLKQYEASGAQRELPATFFDELRLLSKGAAVMRMPQQSSSLGGATDMTDCQDAEAATRSGASVTSSIKAEARAHDALRSIVKAEGSGSASSVVLAAASATVAKKTPALRRARGATKQ